MDREEYSCGRLKGSTMMGTRLLPRRANSELVHFVTGSPIIVHITTFEAWVIKVLTAIIKILRFLLTSG